MPQASRSSLLFGHFSGFVGGCGRQTLQVDRGAKKAAVNPQKMNQSWRAAPFWSLHSLKRVQRDARRAGLARRAAGLAWATSGAQWALHEGNEAAAFRFKAHISAVTCDDL